MESKKLSTTKIIALVQLGTGLMLFGAVVLMLFIHGNHRSNMEVLKVRITFLHTFNRGMI